MTAESKPLNLFIYFSSNFKAMQDKFKSGLNKIQETNEIVARMEEELTALRPKLEQKQQDTEKLMNKLSEDQEKVGPRFFLLFRRQFQPIKFFTHVQFFEIISVFHCNGR